MQFIKDLFSENSNVSMMRVMAFITCMTACYLAVSHGEVGVITALLVAAFGGKVGQKVVEQK